MKGSVTVEWIRLEISEQIGISEHIRVLASITAAINMGLLLSVSVQGTYQVV